MEVKKILQVKSGPQCTLSLNLYQFSVLPLRQLQQLGERNKLKKTQLSFKRQNSSCAIKCIIADIFKELCKSLFKDRSQLSSQTDSF